MMRPISFRWDEELLARIDEARGDVSRSKWLRRAAEQALGQDSAGLQPHGSPTPAEQPERITEAELAAHHQKRREAMRRGEAAQRASASKGRGSEDPGVSSPSLPAPAEQPRMAGRDSLIADGLSRASSSQSKRDVRPRPKGGKR